MLEDAEVMCRYDNVLWKRGVRDNATHALRNAGGAEALPVLVCAVDSNIQLSTIVAALVHLMSTYDHIAGLAAELCGR
eukprot:scaffold67951_cov51-Cyclotella_meneghiniana.AAC.1